MFKTGAGIETAAAAPLHLQLLQPRPSPPAPPLQYQSAAGSKQQQQHHQQLLPSALPWFHQKHKCPQKKQNTMGTAVMTIAAIKPPLHTTDVHMAWQKLQQQQQKADAVANFGLDYH